MNPFDLEILQDDHGERLELARPGANPSRGRLRGWLREATISLERWRGALALKLREASRSPRDFFAFLGVSLLLLLCVALLLFAGYLAVIGLGLVLVVYEFGVWLVAWWVVRETARVAVHTPPSLPRQQHQLQSLALRRDREELRWETQEGSGTVAFHELAGFRLRIETHPGASCRLTAELRTRKKGTRHTLQFSVARLDREEEGVDLCFRMARVLGWSAYTAGRHPLQGLELDFSPGPITDNGAHPFRIQAPSERHPVPAREHSTEDWSVALAPGFREPDAPLLPFAPPPEGTAPFTVHPWKPGTLVGFSAAPTFRPWRVLAGQAAAALVGVMLVLGVLGLWALAARETIAFVPWSSPRKSPAQVLALLASLSSGAGLFMTFPLWWKRSGRVDATFSWEDRHLTFSDDRGSSRLPFDQLAQLVLHEVDADRRRYVLEVELAEAAPLRIYESAPGSDEQGCRAALALTVELARALRIPWRCVAAPGPGGDGPR
jgi:hypothetical protein